MPLCSGATNTVFDLRRTVVERAGRGFDDGARVEVRWVLAVRACPSRSAAIASSNAGYAPRVADAAPAAVRRGTIVGDFSTRGTSGTVRCWGAGVFGQYGDGTTKNRLTPTVVQGICP